VSHWQLTVILLAHSLRCGRDSRLVSHRKPPLCAASCRRAVARWTAEPHHNANMRLITR
jgi:hypothetical protein